MIGHIKSGQYQKNIARAILKKYCPPHKARGIHDFILATKSSVWIIMDLAASTCFYWEVHNIPYSLPSEVYRLFRFLITYIQTDWSAGV